MGNSKAKRIIKLGLLGLVVCGCVALWMAYTDINVSKNESAWRRDYGDKKPVVQEVPFK